MKTSINDVARRACALLPALLFAFALARGQAVEWRASVEGDEWRELSTRLEGKAKGELALSVSLGDSLATLRGFGTCFNELGWDALCLLSPDEADDILRRLFAPDSDLRLSIGRIPMNASDYARSWYSCDEVWGDFDLLYFNIDRDRTTLIPYIKAAQRFNPSLTFWTSPWSPPTWMKANGDYPVLSNARFNGQDPRSDALLLRGSEEVCDSLFPQRLAVSDYLIQDPRYLRSYALYFCRFIDAYRAEGIPITRAMYQNEAWSYTPYPGCAWTAEGITRFNAEYLGPALREHEPGVELFLGTINTNRFDVIDAVMSDPRMQDLVAGLGFQWEGAQILPRLKAKYPAFRYVQTESECGEGTFDWPAAEHTFSLLNRYLGYGCEDYTFWNAVLAGDGVSPWGWRQNALVRIDTLSRKATLTPEYYAAMHDTHALPSGSVLLGTSAGAEGGMPVQAYLTPSGKAVVIAGNLTDSPRQLCVKVGGSYLNAALPAHSFHTFTAR